MKNTFLIITSIAQQDHPILKEFAIEASAHNMPFILIGDAKSPENFNLDGCDFYSIKRQQTLNFELSGILPFNHYARKNLGYLIAMAKGAEIIIETDDDNIPLPEFWERRTKRAIAHLISNKGWVNVYKYFTDIHIWPRGFALEKIHGNIPPLENPLTVECPIQQGLADEDPDVDAIYRMILSLPVKFNKAANIAMGKGSVCPFNSQNTTWFQEAFPLLYLPSFCSMRMTDIWRSFVAQRIAWTCGWPVLFHNSTLRQQRNDHALMNDFREELPGYQNNAKIYDCLQSLNLKEGVENIPDNMLECYQALIYSGFLNEKELGLLNAWLKDIHIFKSR